MGVGGVGGQLTWVIGLAKVPMCRHSLGGRHDGLFHVVATHVHTKSGLSGHQSGQRTLYQLLEKWNL